MEMHEKIALKRNRFGIWCRSLEATVPCHTFLESSLRDNISIAGIVRLYLEPFKRNKDSNLIILKKSPQKFNVFGTIADIPDELPPRPCHTF